MAKIATGRPKGSLNKLNAGQAFVKRVEEILIRADQQKSPFALERRAARFIDCEDLKVAFAVWAKLVEYKFGKPEDTANNSLTIININNFVPRPNGNSNIQTISATSAVPQLTSEV